VLLVCALLGGEGERYRQVKRTRIQRGKIDGGSRDD
jgi:hypothetical protein